MNRATILTPAWQVALFLSVCIVVVHALWLFFDIDRSELEWVRAPLGLAAFAAWVVIGAALVRVVPSLLQDRK